MPLVIPYPSFTPGTTIFSAQVNNNNAAIATWANTHEVATTGVHGITGAFVGTASSNTFTNTNYFSSNNLRIYSSVNPAFYLGFDVNSAFTANRTLFLNFGDSNRTIQLGGNISTAGDLSTAGALATSGAFSLTFTTTAATNVTLPTTGTLATLAGIETLTNKTLTAPSISSPTLSGTALGTYTLGGSPTINNAAINSATISSSTISSPTISNPSISGPVNGVPSSTSTIAFNAPITIPAMDPPTSDTVIHGNSQVKIFGTVNQDGSLTNSYNTSSSSRSGTGLYNVVIDRPFAGNNWPIVTHVWQYTPGQPAIGGNTDTLSTNFDIWTMDENVISVNARTYFIGCGTLS